MNEVFLIGKIAKDIQFDFIINSKNKAMAKFIIRTIDKQLISIKAYDKMADLAYGRLQKGNVVFLYGKLHCGFVEAVRIAIFGDGGKK